MNEQAKIDLDDLKWKKARYETRDGITAVIYADDANDKVKLKIHNYYGHLIDEQHFSYYGHENAVRSAKDYLESQFPDMFRKI